MCKSGEVCKSVAREALQAAGGELAMALEIALAQ